jgi:hypothetical protein
MYLTRETRECPAEFQDRITAMFGVNQFDEPIFKIVWGQTELFRGGTQLKDGRCVYVEKYKCHGMPCWNIMRWKQPAEYGSPDGYYLNTWMSTGQKHFFNNRGLQTFDEPDGFYVTGEYPWTGRYEIVQPLMSRELVDGKLVIEHMELSHLLIDYVIPLMLAFQDLSLAQRAAARELARQEEERKMTEEIADRLADAMPRMNPVSYSNQGCRTALIDKKMEQIQRVWDRMCKAGRRPQFSRGLAQGDRPSPIAHI